MSVPPSRASVAPDLALNVLDPGRRRLAGLVGGEVDLALRALIDAPEHVLVHTSGLEALAILHDRVATHPFAHLFLGPVGSGIATRVAAMAGCERFNQRWPFTATSPGDRARSHLDHYVAVVSFD